MGNWKSWGNYPDLVTEQKSAWFRSELTSIGSSYLAVGLGRSYGDSGLLAVEDGSLVRMSRLDKLIAFDEASRVLTAEAGVSFKELIQWALPRGYFLPVVPGTSYVTLGGAVANDIHGKNHHSDGSFGSWVRGFELYRSDRGWVTCSAEENTDLFYATIGGLGLTGILGTVQVELKRIKGEGLIEQDTREFHSFTEGCEILSEMDKDYPMTVAWVDMGSKNAGSGVAMGGRFCEGKMSKDAMPEPKISVPTMAPEWILNRLSIGAFNRFYKMTRNPRRQKLSCGAYFFPLDSVENWNRFYGRRGFLQYQFVVPLGAMHVLDEIRVEMLKSDERAFLTVLKKFGISESSSLISFPMEGWTLAMDFPMRGAATLDLMDRFDEIVRGAGGRLYAAKDARMPGDFFRESFPKWSELEQLRDPQMMSAFWKRVKL